MISNINKKVSAPALNFVWVVEVLWKCLLLTHFGQGTKLPYGIFLLLMGMLAATISVIHFGLLHLRPL